MQLFSVLHDGGTEILRPDFARADVRWY